MQTTDKLSLTILIVTAAAGPIVLLAIGIPIVLSENGTPKFWTWNGQSWQALATYATGYALALFAAMQLFVNRQNWLVQRARELTHTRQETLRLLTSVQLRFSSSIAGQETVIARLRLADEAANGRITQKSVDLLPGMENHINELKSSLAGC